MDFPEISSDKTHHVYNGSAIYERRFLLVKSFCFPGIAAVKDESGWYHIDFFGNPIYSERYQNVGDFCDNTARVQMSNGKWFYISETGKRIDPMDFVWGSDFKDGIACVYHEKKGATHITTYGELVYNDWYLDVRPFEGEKAKIRDDSGWHYVDKNGLILGDAAEPSDMFPRGKVCQSHQKNKIAEIVYSHTYDACVILIRHAEREPFWRGEGGFNKKITERGKLAAQEFGRSLPQIVCSYASTIPRCMITAELIAGSKTVGDGNLGNPGAYVYDNSLCHEYLLDHNPISAIQNYIKGEVLPGHYPIKKGTELYLAHLKSLAVDGGCVLCVTHDAFLVSLIATITGYDFSDDWMDFLDGCVLFKTGNSWKLVWREGEYPL